MITYSPRFDPLQDFRIDWKKTIRITLPPLSTGTESGFLWKQSLNTGNMDQRTRMHSYMEKKIRGVRYKVYSVFEGDADFRQLYEKCLADRLLRLYGQDCAESAAGD